MRKLDVNQAKDLRKRLHIYRFHFFFRKISPDAVEIASRRSIRYVPTQHRIRPDVVKDASRRSTRYVGT